MLHQIMHDDHLNFSQLILYYSNIQSSFSQIKFSWGKLQSIIYLISIMYVCKILNHVQLSFLPLAHYSKNCSSYCVCTNILCLTGTSCKSTQKIDFYVHVNDFPSWLTIMKRKTAVNNMEKTFSCPNLVYHKSLIYLFFCS